MGIIIDTKFQLQCPTLVMIMGTVLAIVMVTDMIIFRVMIIVIVISYDHGQVYSH